MSTILGIGECMVELSPRSEGHLDKSFAGDVFNTLWYARSALGLGWNVAFHSGFGNDAMSHKMKEFIEDANISCNSSPTISDRVPGLYMIHLDGAERSFSYWRDTSAARKMMQDAETLWTKVRESDLVFLSGITLAILSETDCDQLLAGLRENMAPNAKLAFDPNIRPRLWNDMDRMRTVISEAASVSDIVMPSFEDEQIWFGDTKPEETAKRYQSLGATQVIVKNGEDATLVLNNDELSLHPVAPVSGVVDTTAAGDSFNGGYLAELLQTNDVNKAVRAAQTCAGTCVCFNGALVPFERLQS